MTKKRSGKPASPAKAKTGDASRRFWHSSSFRAGVLFVAAFVVHLPALPGTFFWDDYDWIVNNPRVRADDGLYRLWFDTDQADYWPMHYSTHWFEWRIWGEWALPYRVLNQLFHGLNAVLVWVALARLGVPGAWLCAMVFAVHPVNVESTAWISQRKTVMSTAGVLFSLLAYLHFLQNRQWRWWFVSFVSFLMGLLTKSAVVMWPPAMLICVWWRHYQTQRSEMSEGANIDQSVSVANPNGRANRPSVFAMRPANVWPLAPFFFVSLILGLFGTLLRGHQVGIELARDDGLISRLALSGRVVWFYLYKLAVPLELSVVYPRWELGRTDVSAFLPLAALVGCFALFLIFCQTWGAACLAGFGYYVVNLFPVMGFITIIFMRYSLVADHWQYLAMPGAIAVFVGGATYLVKRNVEFQGAGRVLAAVWILALAAGSWQQAKIWRGADNEPIWRDTLTKNPQAELPHLRLAIILARRGEYAPAIKHICEASKYAIPPVAWGEVVVDAERMQRATQHRFARMLPQAADSAAGVRYSLGSAYYVMGQYQQAADYLSEAIRLDPEFAAAYYNLSLVFEAVGMTDDARKYRMAAEQRATRQSSSGGISQPDY